MAYKSFKPYTPGRRQMTVSTFEEITTDTPEKSLLAPVHNHGGRNGSGKTTVRQTVPAASHCCSMQMVKNATSSLRKV